MAEIPPLEREIAAWTLANGLAVSERRIPIGTVGANFEARPNVALDVAGQLLQQPEHGRAADGRRRAANRDGARRRRSATGARARRPAARSGRSRALARPREAHGSS